MENFIFCVVFYMAAPSFIFLIFLPGKEINHIINLDERNISELKLLIKLTDKPTNKSIKTVGSRTGFLYWLGKYHKENQNALPAFGRVLLAIGTPSCKLAKIFMEFLKPSTANKYTVLIYFNMHRKIYQDDSKLCMAVQKFR